MKSFTVYSKVETSIAHAIAKVKPFSDCRYKITEIGLFDSHTFFKIQCEESADIKSFLEESFSDPIFDRVVCAWENYSHGATTWHLDNSEQKR